MNSVTIWVLLFLYYLLIMFRQMFHLKSSSFLPTCIILLFMDMFDAERRHFFLKAVCWTKDLNPDHFGQYLAVNLLSNILLAVCRRLYYTRCNMLVLEQDICPMILLSVVSVHSNTILKLTSRSEQTFEYTPPEALLNSSWYQGSKSARLKYVSILYFLYFCKCFIVPVLSAHSYTEGH
jgi:hypothetical protein